MYALEFANTFQNHISYELGKKDRYIVLYYPEGFICTTYLYPHTLHNILKSDSMLDFPLSRHTLCKYFCINGNTWYFLSAWVSDM